MSEKEGNAGDTNPEEEKREEETMNGGNHVKTTEDFNLACVYVSDAQFNRNIFFDTSPQAVRLYLLYNHWFLKVLLYFFILVDLSLSVFEEPAVIPLPTWATMLVELLCLLVFSLRLVHYAQVIPRDKFWKDPKNLCIMVVLMLTLVDLIVFGALMSAGCSALRWSRVLRPLLLVNVTEGRQLRRAFRSIRNALPQISSVFLLFMFSVLIFSLMALKLLGKRGLVTNNGSPYFTNYLEIVFNLYVLVTTANSPDVMMPAYNLSLVYAIFFIVYILVNTYIFMSVFLAVVYNNYKKHLKEEVRQLVRAKRHKMVRAFAVLQERGGQGAEPGGQGAGPVSEGAEPVVSHNNWNQLVRLVRPDISNAHRQLLWSVSDNNNQGCIGKVAFVQLADLLNIEVITLKSRPHPLSRLCPALYLSGPSRLLCRLVRHRAFVIIYDIIILVNAVFIGLDEANELIANSEWVFLALYLLEVLLKLYVFEPRTFFSRHNFWNWFDTIIVVSALVASVTNSALKSSGGYTSRQILDIVFILRVLRLIRVVDNIRRFRTIINTLVRIGPAILTFGQLILVVYYVFAMVGMELFKHKVRFSSDPSDPNRSSCGDARLEGTSFAQLNYCKNNFNNVLSSFVLLLELTVVNQWHVLSSGFATVTHPSALIFFVLFHILVVIVIINIFVAFVLEAFLVEYSVEKGDLQTSVEKKISELELSLEQDTQQENLVDAMETMDHQVESGQSGASSEPGLRFRIASKRYRTVDALLQRMFESDLDPEDFAESEEAENFSNPSFCSA